MWRGGAEQAREWASGSSSFRIIALVFGFFGGQFKKVPAVSCQSDQPAPLLKPPKLQEQRGKPDDRLTIVVCGLTGVGKSALCNLLSGSTAFTEGCQFASVTTEVKHFDFSFRGRKFRIIDTPGVFDTSFTQEEVETSISHVAKHAASGVNAVVIAGSKGRLTKESEVVCKFTQCVLGEEALQKYGMFVVTHTEQTADELRDELHALPKEDLGRRMLETVCDRVMPADKEWWWQRCHGSQQRKNILEAVVQLSERNGYMTIDCDMLRWERIREQLRQQLQAENEETIREQLRQQLQAENEEAMRQAQREVGASECY